MCKIMEGAKLTWQALKKVKKKNVKQKLETGFIVYI